MAYDLNRFQTDVSIIDVVPYRDEDEDNGTILTDDYNAHVLAMHPAFISFQTPGMNLGIYGGMFVSTTKNHGTIYAEPVGLGSFFGYTSFRATRPLVPGLEMTPDTTSDFAYVGLGSLGTDLVPYSFDGGAHQVVRTPFLLETKRDEQKFNNLSDKWREERGISSSTIDIVTCDSYQQIIGMGERALPYIFARLRQEGSKPDQWFWALRMITQENPVPREAWGNRKEMAKHWLQWAQTNGFIEG